VWAFAAFRYILESRCARCSGCTSIGRTPRCDALRLFCRSYTLRRRRFAVQPNPGSLNPTLREHDCLDRRNFVLANVSEWIIWGCLRDGCPMVADRKDRAVRLRAKPRTYEAAKSFAITNPQNDVTQPGEGQESIYACKYAFLLLAVFGHPNSRHYAMRL
jgi:hypothetical protein